MSAIGAPYKGVLAWHIVQLLLTADATLQGTPSATGTPVAPGPVGTCV
jgi:hypothetical protein